MIRDKSYEIIFKFVKVMHRILQALFSGHGVFKYFVIITATLIFSNAIFASTETTANVAILFSIHVQSFIFAMDIFF